jgi:hypothetical protein
VAPARLKSSFIYLANGVNDLRGSWTIIGLILAPLVIAASLCLLPDAIKLQHDLVHDLSPGERSVVYVPAQDPGVAAPAGPVTFWIQFPTRPLHILAFLIALAVNLLVLCELKRMRAGARAPTAVAEALAVYRNAIPLVPAFFFILLLQVLAIAVGAVLLVIPGLLAYVWLYFSQYALVFDGLRSWPALLHSRDLMRGRFFKVATRIVVFLAVWSGYNSWVGGAFVALSLLLEPLGYLVGRLSSAVFVLDLLAVSVAFVTTAFFMAASARLYQDLNAVSGDQDQDAKPIRVETATAPLTELSA